MQSLVFLDRVSEAHEQVSVQAFRSELALEALDERIIDRLTRLQEDHVVYTAVAGNDGFMAICTDLARSTGSDHPSRLRSPQDRSARELADQALAHEAGSNLERAYRRSGALELMQTWSDICA